MENVNQKLKNSAALRPTKKQHDLLEFIAQFIEEKGYSPSYREIMKGLNYTSVATVALHINNLIKRGHLIKRNHSARSLEVVKTKIETEIIPKQLKASEEKWLVKKTDVFFNEAEKKAHLTERDLDELYVLTGALKVLGLDGAASSFISRLSELKKKISNSKYSV